MLGFHAVSETSISALTSGGVLYYRGIANLASSASIVADLILHDVDLVTITLYIDKIRSLDLNIDKQLDATGYIDQVFSVSLER